MLGLFHCSDIDKGIGIEAKNERLIERFVAIAVNDLAIKPESITIESTGEDKLVHAHFHNAKLRKLLQKALEEREHIFKYRNEYSASYFAALYDRCGGIGRSGLYIRHLDVLDEVLLERLGFYISSTKKACYIRNGKEFLAFISKYSVK